MTDEVQESLGHTMYWLEVSINQDKKCDWDKQPESIKKEWNKYAKSILHIAGEIK